LKSKAVFDAACVSLRTTDNALQRLNQFYECRLFGDLCHVVASGNHQNSF